MNKVFILIVMLSCLLIKEKGFCSAANSYKEEFTKSQKNTFGVGNRLSLLSHEIDAIENGSDIDKIKKVTKWLNTLEAKVLKKLKKSEERLEKYKNQSEDSEEGDSEKALKKIKSSETKVETCQELLLIINQLKTKLASKEQSLN